jgi:hypothetical protein
MRHRYESALSVGWRDAAGHLGRRIDSRSVQGGSRPIGENDFDTIHGVGVGGTLQVTGTAALFGHENHVVFGGSLDHAIVDFQTSAELGVINPMLQVLTSGFFVDTTENTNFNAVPLSSSLD